VVREVVVDLHAARLAAQLEAAAHVVKAASAAAASLGRDAHMLGRGDGRQRVELVVLAQQRPIDAAIFRLPRSTSKACGSPRARSPPGSSRACQSAAPGSSSRAPARAAAPRRAR
jgi:hypothetical protein